MLQWTQAWLFPATGVTWVITLGGGGGWRARGEGKVDRAY